MQARHIENGCEHDTTIKKVGSVRVGVSIARLGPPSPIYDITFNASPVECTLNQPLRSYSVSPDRATPWPCHIYYIVLRISNLKNVITVDPRMV